MRLMQTAMPTCSRGSSARLPRVVMGRKVVGLCEGTSPSHGYGIEATRALRSSFERVECHRAACYFPASLDEELPNVGMKWRRERQGNDALQRHNILFTQTGKLLRPKSL